jgi:hypothetical protein
LAAAAERRAERDDRKVRRVARVVAKGYNTIGDLVDRIADRIGDEGPVRLEINQALREAAGYARATADMLVQVADPSAATSAIDGAGVGRGEIPAKVRRAERRQQLAAEHTGPYRWMGDEQLLTYHRSAAEAVRLAKHAAAEERTRPTVSEQEIEQAVRFLNPQLAADRDSLRATRAFVERAEQGGHKVRHEPGSDPHDRIEKAWQQACGEVRAKTAQSSPQAATWDQRAHVANRELGAISQEIARRSKLSTPQRHADAELRERHQQQLQRRIPGNLAVDHAAAGVHGVSQHLTHAMAAAGGHAGLGTP